MEIFFSILLGIGLSASCGFRIFVPFLVISIASYSGHLTLSSGFDWMGTLPALIVFAMATVLEIAAYYIPWLDNLLDTVAGPVAVVAGVIMTASVISDMDPLLKWTLAVIAGGGAAGVVQGLTTFTRAASSLTTGGLGNPVISTAEAVGSVGLSLLSILVPVAGGVVVLILVYMTFRALRRHLARKRLST